MEKKEINQLAEKLSENSFSKNKNKKISNHEAEERKN